MAQKNLTGAYSYWEVPGDQPVRFVGPALRIYPRLSIALGDMLVSAPRRSDALRKIAAVVWALNLASRHCDDPAALVETSAKDCERAIFSFLSAAKARTRKATNGGDRYWISPPSELHGKVGIALTAFCDLTERLSKTAYGGIDPCRIAAAPSTIFIPQPGPYRRDTGRRFRLSANPASRPRSNDPRIFDRWAPAAHELGIHEVSIWVARICRAAGCRFMSVQGLNLADVLIFADSFATLPAISKGSKGVRVLRLVLPQNVADELEQYVSRVFPEHYRQWQEGRLPSAKRLARIPLFSLNGLRPIPYSRYHRDFCAAAARADLYFREVDAGVETRRLVTPQQLRHEYVFHRLMQTENLPAAEQMLHRNAIAAYLGWSSGQAMLEHYSHFYAQLNAMSLARRAHVSPRDEARDAPAASGPAARSIADLLEMVA